MVNDTLLRPSRNYALLLAAAYFIFFGCPLAQGNPAQSPSAAPPQSEAAAVPQYDVAAIKPSKSGDMRMMLMFKPDGVDMTGVPVQLMLRVTFNIEDDRILGAPEWVKTERFDINAKVAPEDAPKLDKLSRGQRDSMLLPLLADRFGLKYHHETRDLPYFALVVAKGGPKLKESTPEPGGAEGSPKRRMTLINGMGNIEGQGSTMENLAHVLTPQVGRMIMDKTGLTGAYDYTLHWTPDNVPMPGGPGGGPGGAPTGAPAAGGPPPPDASAPGLLTALQEQLGLKLESEKGPVDVIVIDHIDKPSEN
jgi:bla regulator protein blaR1